MALAARGARNMDAGIEKIEDESVVRQIRRQARKVYVKSLVAGVLLTTLVALIPNPK